MTEYVTTEAIKKFKKPFIPHEPLKMGGSRAGSKVNNDLKDPGPFFPSSLPFSVDWLFKIINSLSEP